MPDRLNRLLRRSVIALTASILLSLASLATVSGQSPGVYVSDDGGTTWRRSEQSPPGTILALHADPSLPGWVIAGTDLGVWITPDAGETWVEIEAQQFGDGQPIVYAIADDPSAPETLWIATDLAVFRSLDAGQSWQPVGDPGQVLVCLIAATDAEGTVLYGGGVAGLVRSVTMGDDWEPDGDGIEGAVTALAVDTTGALLVGTTSGLFARHPGSDTYRIVPGLPRGIVRGLSTLPNDRVYAGIGPQLYVREGSWRRVGVLPLAASGEPPIISSIAPANGDEALVGSSHGLYRAPALRLDPALQSLADLEVGPVIADRADPNRRYLGASDQPHAAALVRASIEFGPDIDHARDDLAALAAILPFLGGGLLAAWYLTRRRT